MKRISAASSAGEAGVNNSGPGGTGGGDALHSNHEDLQEVVDNFYQSIWQISDSYLAGGAFQITNQELEPQLRSVVKMVLGTQFFSVSKETSDYLKGLKYNIIDTPCYDRGVEKDASTEYRKNAPVCLSAKRLWRFPKSLLRAAVLPLLFHELAHQNGLNEEDANKLEQLADIHLKFRALYLAGFRAQTFCGGASKMTDSKEKIRLLSYGNNGEHFIVSSFGGEANILTTTLQCGSQAARANLMLSQNFVKDPSVGTLGLGDSDRSLLMNFYGEKETKFTFRHITWALTHSMDEYTNTKINKLGADAPYVLSVAGRAVVGLVDEEVGRLQNTIK